MTTYRVAVIPGDGIGNEVIPAAIRTLEAAAERFAHRLDAAAGAVVVGLEDAVDGELHDARMSEELARHGYKISPGTLYPMLHRMQTRA